MHYARIEQSPRLQAVYAALKEGPKSTKDLIKETGYCAINSIAAEMRAQGIPVVCHLISRINRTPIYMYRIEEDAA